MLHIGVDVGGTFTDLILLDDATGQLRSAKVPTTVRNQAEGFLAGIKALGVSLDTVSRIFHGMTTGTNAVLEHRGARLALVTTRGFRDALELGRGKRMVPASMFDTRFQKPKPLVPRSRRYEVGERLRYDGAVLTPLPEDELEAVCEQIAADDVEVVVVCFLNSFANPAHEQAAETVVRRSLPNVMTTISSDVVPEFREYERFSTATLNGYIQPVMNRYLGRLESELAAAGYDRDLYIMASGGGTMTSTTARARPVNTILSGPAGGVNGAVFVAGAAGVRNLITYDMGGTSTDVCLVTDLKPSRTTESIIAGQPMKVPQIDIKTIGAGGGSIAYLDEGGVLNVGPRSAGAEPGPACYGRGGTEPTVSDANVVLGRIDPDAVLGGAIHLQPDLAVQAVEGLGQRVGVSGGVAMAEGILRISVAKMASAIREVSIERGYDPRDYTLLAFGGAGPMHVAAIAAELGIRQILVPLYPGNLSALGVLTSDVQHDYVRTLLRKLPDLRWDELQAAWEDLRAAAADRLARD
ncbi:MAG: hydantoinase/oxoprolinase family protein, partial [Chloroflexi bacterium]|nr:hydantoinase/oxoprolinase family protein [Chloroflexota bacterium]